MGDEFGGDYFLGVATMNFEEAPEPPPYMNRGVLASSAKVAYERGLYNEKDIHAQGICNRRDLFYVGPPSSCKKTKDKKTKDKKSLFCTA